MKKLRDSGLACETEYAFRTRKGQASYSSKLGPEWWVTIRSDDAIIRRRGQDRDAEQIRIPIAECADYILRGGPK